MLQTIGPANKIFRATAGLLLLVSAARCDAFNGGKSKGNTQENQLFDAKVTVTAPPVTKQNDDAILIVKLTNNSKQALEYVTENGIWELDMSIIAEDGHRVSLTNLGEQNIWLMPERERREKLEPGQSHIYKLAINKYFGLVPGKYFISVRLSLARPPNFFLVRVSKVPFEIK